MNSKTPQFDALLQPILDALVPHTRECLWKGKHEHCEGEFEIQEGDIEFLRMLRVPPPNYCPTCRRMRRLVHMNLTRLFKRSCNAPEHSETMISIIPSECPFPVYDYQYFISDAFDPFSFGRTYAGGSPMEELFNLRKVFPMPSFLNRDPSCINSDYSNGGRDLKNGYFVMGCYRAEDVWYSHLIIGSKMVMDSRAIQNSEFVYKSVFSEHLFKCSYAYFSNSCTDSMFLFDCRNCQDCFGCVNLRNAKYCVFNQQLTKEGYMAFLASISPLSRSMLSECENKFWELVKAEPMNASRNMGSTGVSGVNIKRCQDLFDAIDSENTQHVRHVDSVNDHKDSMDVLFSGGNSSMIYGTTNIGSSSGGVRFSVSSKFCTNSEFVFNSKNISNCFMCFGLQNKSYCILNKQYTEEEYYPLVDALKSEMLRRGEYGDGLGMEFSAQAYNFSIGNVSFPLSGDTIRTLGGYTGEEPETNVGDMGVMQPEDVPETIDEVSDALIAKAMICKETGRPFRVIQSELDFYRRMKLPLPTVHPTVRMESSFHMATMAKKHTVNCASCQRSIDSMFPKESGFILYCETCYQKEIL